MIKTRVDREHLYWVLRYGHKKSVAEPTENTEDIIYEQLDHHDAHIIADLYEKHMGWKTEENQND